MQVPPLPCWMPKREPLDLRVCSTTAGGQGVHHWAGYAVFPGNFLHLPQGPVRRRCGPRSLRHLRDVRGGRHARRPARGCRARCPAGLRHGPAPTRQRRPVMRATSQPAVGPPLETWVGDFRPGYDPCPGGRQNCGTSLLAKELKDGQDREDSQTASPDPPELRGNHVDDRRLGRRNCPDVGCARSGRALASGRAVGPAF